MTRLEINAIRRLERAFKVCADLGIKFCGMDDNLIFATEECLDAVERRRTSDYNEVAVSNQENMDGAGHVNTHGAYLDSGGY
jgi:hypothetical protein